MAKLEKGTPRSMVMEEYEDHEMHHMDKMMYQHGFKRMWFKWIFLVLFAIGISMCGFFLYKRYMPIDISKEPYKAVFLTNGQVYFGKIQRDFDGEVDLIDIYYLQLNNSQLQGTDKSATSSDKKPELSIVKLGNELHGPEDLMMISKRQILFIENLKETSSVVKAIQNYKAK